MTHGGKVVALISSPTREGEHTMRNGRKGTMMVALVALLVAIFATAAYAQTFIGDSGNDTFTETPGNDQMYGYGGEDELLAYIYGGDRDKLYGGRGNDYLEGHDGDGDDLIVGGKGGDDECYADFGDEVHSCDGNVTRY